MRLQKKMFCRNILQKWLTLAGLSGLGARLCLTCVHSRPRPRDSGPPRPPRHHQGRRLGCLSSEPARWHFPPRSTGRSHGQAQAHRVGAFILPTGGHGQPGGASGARWSGPPVWPPGRKGRDPPGEGGVEGQSSRQRPPRPEEGASGVSFPLTSQRLGPRL